METAESRAKLANAIRDLKAKGQTQAIPTLVSAYKNKYKPQPITPTIDQQKEQLQSRGLPTSVRQDRAEPTIAGQIVRGIIKAPVKVALSVARPFADPLAKKDFSFDSKYLGNVGDFGTEINKRADVLTDKYAKGEISLGRAALGGAGAGLEQAMDVATLMPVGGVAGQAVKGTIKNSVIPTLKSATKTAITRGGSTGVGYDVSNQLASGEKYDPLQTLASGAIGTVADLGLSYGLPKTVAGTKSFAKNNLTKTGRDAKLTRKVEEELRNVENNYAKLRKNQKFSKDANTETRKRIIASGVLDDATDTTGTINTDNAIKKYRDASGLTGNEGVVRENLERLGEKVNLKSVEKELTDSIYASGLEGAELRTALNNVKKEISGYRLRADANGDVPLTFIHDTKIGTTSGINFMTPPEVKAYKKALASGLRSTVENNSQFNVKEVNQELSPLFKDIEYLESLNGRKVKGGKLSKYASQIAGNVAGGVTGGAIGGFPGAAVGTVVGGEVGSALRGASLSKVLRGPGSKELPVSDILKKASATAKSPRLGLPEPKTGLPKSQNFVPIELPGVKEPVYQSPRIAGKTTQYINIPSKKPKNIDIPTQLPKSKVKSSDLSTGDNKVAYHGTQAKQIVGTPNATDGSMGKAFYVTDNKGKAEVFGKEKNVLNQVITNNKGKKVKQYARESGYYKTSNVFDINLNGLNIKEFKDSNEFFKYISNSSKKDIPDWFKLSGYDGAYIKDSGTYAIYSPEKIKMPKGNQGVSLAKNTTEDLVQEAKKYKSAEEFVKAQGTINPDNIEYHGTGKSFDRFVLGEEGSSGAGTENLGVFTTKSKNAAKFWAEKSAGVGKDGNVVKVYLDIKNPKVFKSQEALDNFLGDNPEQAIEMLKKQGFDAIKYPESGIDKFPFDYWDELASKGVEFKNKLPDEPYMTTQVFDPKKVYILGKDGIAGIKNKIGNPLGEYPVLANSKISDIQKINRLDDYSLTSKEWKLRVHIENYANKNDLKFNDAKQEIIDAIKTKSQLTDIWNKANKTGLPKAIKLIRNKDGSVTYGKQKMSGDFTGMTDKEIIKTINDTPF